MKWRIVERDGEWTTGRPESLPFHGSAEGAEALITIEVIDGEREYSIECLCPACHQVDQIGIQDLWDPDGDAEPGNYYVKSWFEEIVIPFVGTEYDAGLALNEDPEST